MWKLRGVFPLESTIEISFPTSALSNLITFSSLSQSSYTDSRTLVVAKFKRFVPPEVGSTTCKLTVELDDENADKGPILPVILPDN